MKTSTSPGIPASCVDSSSPASSFSGSSAGAVPSLVRLEGISKSFGRVRANHNIHLDIAPGRIKALLGENGAGKSTLMSILAGRLQPDCGRIYSNGRPVVFSSPKDALLAGIGMVYQHFMLIPSMSVAENILLGYGTGLCLQLKKMHKRLEELSAFYGLDIDPAARVSTLSMGERQRVEIVKLLCRESRVLIFDEPTSMLTPNETAQLFVSLRRMAEQGKALIFISHKLPEVLEIADEIAILRRGEVVDSFERCNVPDEAELARRMLGRELCKGGSIPCEVKPTDTAAEIGETEATPSEANPGACSGASSENSSENSSETSSEANAEQALGMLPGPKHTRLAQRMRRADPVLVVADVSCHPADSVGVHGISFSVARGEILAIVGVAGNGQKELVEVISGLREVDRGAVQILGLAAKDYFKRKPAYGGLGYIPEDRRGLASCPDLNLVDNVLLTPRKLFTHAGLLNRKKALEATRTLIGEHNVYPGNPAAKGKDLSGGNLQKLIVGRELARNPGVIVAENPTQGLDVAAMEEVWQRLRNATRSSGILLVTGDMSEAMTLADRLAVMYRGTIVDIFSVHDQKKVSQIGLMMAGSTAAAEC